MPPECYKRHEYHSCVVSEQGSVLRELSAEIPNLVVFRVIDGTAYLNHPVLPKRPLGTKQLTEDDLAALIKRDTMVRLKVIREFSA